MGNHCSEVNFILSLILNPLNTINFFLFKKTFNTQTFKFSTSCTTLISFYYPDFMCGSKTIMSI